MQLQSSTVSFLVFFFLFSYSSFAQKDNVEKLKNDFSYLISTKQWQAAEQKMNMFYESYPSNPSELDRVEKYEVDKFARTIKEAVYGEERAYKAIKSTRSSSLCQEYLSKYPYGKYKIEVREIFAAQNEEDAWQTAKKKYTTAAYYTYLSSFPDGKYSNEARSTINQWDKNAYQEAIEKNTLISLRYYLDYYPKGKYRKDVRDILNARKEEEAWATAKRENYVSSYEKYLKNYPYGKHVQDANRIISYYLFRLGTDKFKSKKYSSAKTYFKSYLSKFPSGANATEARKNIRKCDMLLNQTGGQFLMYAGDTQSPIGLSIGSLDVRKVSFYMTFSMNSNVFKAFDVIYEIDNNGNHDHPGNVLSTGNNSVGLLGLSVGVTYKIYYPIWVYAGVGIGYTPTYQEVDTYYSSGSFWETEWFLNSDKSIIDFYPEFGLKTMLFNKLVLKAGMIYRYSLDEGNQFGFQFGLGLTF